MNSDKMQALTQLAVKWYPEKKLAHALRVAAYASDQPLVEETDRDSLWAIGLLHDILEDTQLPQDELYNLKLLNAEEYDAIEILTHHKTDCSYEDYMKEIEASNNPFVKIVKRADMKDHLMLTDTLTDKLKNKYYPTVKYIL